MALQVWPVVFCCMHSASVLLAFLRPGVHHHLKSFANNWRVPWKQLFNCFPACGDTWGCFTWAAKLCPSPYWMAWGSCWPNLPLLQGCLGFKLCHSACQLCSLMQCLRVQSVPQVSSWWGCWTIFPPLMTLGALCLTLSLIFALLGTVA